MANQYKENPTWKELKVHAATRDELEDLQYKYELLLDPIEYTIIFFANRIQLKAQEYKFLRAILTKKGERVQAEKLMKQIKSTCKPELMQNLSYRIKSKIKKKIKEGCIGRVPLDGNEWILLDRNPSAEMDGFGKVIYYQSFNPEQYFNMLIRVKDGYYRTEFLPS